SPLFPYATLFRSQGLGWNAPPIEADPAEIGALDNGGLEAKLGGANGRDVAARSGADDDEIEVGFCHEGIFSSVRGRARHARPRPSGWSLLFQAKIAEFRATPPSDVAARPQILVEQNVVAIDPGLRGGGHV